jgi:hypothetical protein
MIHAVATIAAALSALPIPGTATITNFVVFTTFAMLFKRYYRVAGSLCRRSPCIFPYEIDPSIGKKVEFMTERVTGGLLVNLVPDLLVETSSVVPVVGTIAAAVMEFMWVVYEGSKVIKHEEYS